MPVRLFMARVGGSKALLHGAIMGWRLHHHCVRHLHRIECFLLHHCLFLKVVLVGNFDGSGCAEEDLFTTLFKPHQIDIKLV